MNRKVRKLMKVLKEGLIGLYGEKLKDVYLYGSFARGEGRLPDSDVDVMIVLKDDFNRREVEKKSSDFIASLCLEYDVLISWFFVSNTEYEQSRMPFMITARRDAVTI